MVWIHVCVSINEANTGSLNLENKVNDVCHLVCCLEIILGEVRFFRKIKGNVINFCYMAFVSRGQLLMD